MKIYTKEELNNYHQSLTYDDITLVPEEISEVRSRADINIKTEFLSEILTTPIISSPMDTVSGLAMVSELTNLGAIGIVNRFDSSLSSLFGGENYSNVKAVSISLTADDKLIEKIAERNFIVCIDTANANNKYVLEKCEDIKKKYNLRVIVGNIANGITLTQLVDSGADAVRVGIGGGSVCTTSIQTGIGIGQVSSVLDTYFAREDGKMKISIIADGGVKSPGDVIKALALGADIVMLGRMLAGTKETPGEVIKYNDQLWKKYRGSASFGVKMKGEFIEGEETMVPYKGPVKNIVNGISDGLKSAMSYMNCSKVEELSTKAKFTILSNSSYLERLPKK
ncbi:hypothetical protein APF79_04680 [bacterium BRH_c32]|nr:MAG: hypothetical protein APF79_04680 [bacterium BRH_c32]